MTNGQKIGIALLVAAFLFTKIWLIFAKPTGIAVASIGAAFLILDTPASAA